MEVKPKAGMLQIASRSPFKYNKARDIMRCADGGEKRLCGHDRGRSFSFPTPPTTIRRSRILDKLSKLESSKPALLTAPASFGKTVVLAQLRPDLVSAGATVLSLTLTGDDALPRRTWKKLVRAFDSFGIGALGKTSTPAGEDYRSDLLSIAGTITRHINENGMLH